MGFESTIRPKSDYERREESFQSSLKTANEELVQDAERKGTSPIQITEESINETQQALRLVRNGAYISDKKFINGTLGLKAALTEIGKMKAAESNVAV